MQIAMKADKLYRRVYVAPGEVKWQSQSVVKWQMIFVQEIK